jgi:restriction system protein
VTNSWLVRAGGESKHALAFANAHAIAVGWNDIPGLADLRDLESAEVEALLANAPAVRTVGADLQELLLFRDVLQPGDLVVTPDAQVRQIMIGEITGPYEYRADDPVGDYHHVRSAKWFGRILRNSLAPGLSQDTNYRRTIRRLDAHAADWQELAQRAQMGGALPIEQRRSPETKRPAHREARRPHKDTSETKRCAECGQQRSLAQYETGSDLCVDCR